MDRLSRKQIASIIICTSLVGIALWLYKNIIPAKPYSIGLVWIPSRAFQEQLGTSFIDIIKTDKRFSLKDFAAPSAAELISLNAVCETALNSDVDLILCIGFSCAKSLAQLSKKRRTHKPVVFNALTKEMALEIVDSLDSPGGPVTGVYDAGIYAAAHPIEILLTLKPQAKSILMPYAIVAHDNEPHVLEAQEIATLKNTQVTPFPINPVEETLARITSVIESHDTIMYLEADLLSPYGAGIGKLASQHNVTLFACSPDAKDTAAFTYYAEFNHIARAGFELAQRILINKENPATTHIVKLTNSRQVTINVERCREQGMPDIDPLKIMHAINSNPKLAALHNRITVNHNTEVS
ncbi:MAG: ABC transporter substrate binding protein [bacterium]